MYHQTESGDKKKHHCTVQSGRQVMGIQGFHFPCITVFLTASILWRRRLVSIKIEGQEIQRGNLEENPETDLSNSLIIRQV